MSYTDDYYEYPLTSYADPYSTSPSEYTTSGVGDASWRPGGSGILDTLLAGAKNVGAGLMTPRGLVGLAGILAGYLDRDKKGRMGEKLNLSPSKVTKKVVPGKYGPISMTEFAANGGLMQAYATGGVLTGTKQNPLPMEDGGFVLTADAVRKGTPDGIRQLLPQAQMIRGPGTGTSDDIPATIAGRTPALVSNGEMYVPKAQVDDAGGAQALYALMRQLERRA